MVAKILLCVALCNALYQVALATQDKAYYAKQQDVSETEQNSTTCQESVQKAREKIAELASLTDNVQVELKAIIVKGALCLKSKDIRQCLEDAVKESSIINGLIESISNVMKSCIDQRFMLIIENILPLLTQEYVRKN